MSGSDPVTLSSNTKAVVAFSLVQLHGANLSPDQPLQDVHQLQKQTEQSVPVGCVAELRQLLEWEQRAAQQLCQECSLQQEEGRRQRVSGNKSPEVPADGEGEGEVGSWVTQPKTVLVPRGRWPNSHPTSMRTGCTEAVGPRFLL